MAQARYVIARPDGTPINAIEYDPAAPLGGYPLPTGYTLTQSDTVQIDPSINTGAEMATMQTLLAAAATP